VVAAMLKDLSPVVAFESRRASRIKKAAAAQIGAAALLALTATGAAAAGAGSLPGPLQRGVSGALGHAGLNVPNGHKDSDSNQAASSKGNGQQPNGGNGGNRGNVNTLAGPQTNGPGPNANADFGLCTAFLAAPQGQGADHSASPDHSQKDNSTAFQALTNAHPDTVAYCNGVIQDKKAAQGPNDPNGAPGNSGSTGPPASPGNSDSTGKPATPAGNGQGKPTTPPGQNNAKPSTTSSSEAPGSPTTGSNGGDHSQGNVGAGGGQANRS